MNAVNLLGFDLQGLAAYCEQLGEEISRHPAVPLDPSKGASDFAQMSDLAKACATSSPAEP